MAFTDNPWTWERRKAAWSAAYDELTADPEAWHLRRDLVARMAKAGKIQIKTASDLLKQAQALGVVVSRGRYAADPEKDQHQVKWGSPETWIHPETWATKPTTPTEPMLTFVMSCPVPACKGVAEVTVHCHTLGWTKQLCTVHAEQARLAPEHYEVGVP